MATFLIATSSIMAADKKAKEDQDKPEDPQATLKACGTKENEVNYTPSTDKSSHPAPEPSEGKAMIYVLRPTMMGNKVQTKLAVDGVWKGSNRGKNYFFFPVEPGEHYFCSKAENLSVVALKAEPGKTYYLQQHVRLGVMKARNTLEVMVNDEGKNKLRDCHLSTAKSH
jgi:hypothetical protein